MEKLRYKIKKFENTFIKCNKDFEHKKSISNWAKCVTRTSDRKLALGLKNHGNADKAVKCLKRQNK